MANKQLKSNIRAAFTLMEVMTAMAIISIVTSVVLPGINNFYSSTRVKAAAETFVAAVRLGKYRAMQEASVHRIIFNADRTAFKIQTYVPDDEDYSGALLKSSQEVDPTLPYDSEEWASVEDTEEIEIDSNVEIHLSNFKNPTYFWPNGYLIWDALNDPMTEVAKAPIPEGFVTFVYGSSAIRVVINSIGILSSEAYQVDEDTNYDNDGVLW